VTVIFFISHSETGWEREKEGTSISVQTSNEHFVTNKSVRVCHSQKRNEPIWRALSLVPFRSSSVARTPVQRENISSSIVLRAVLRLAPPGNKTRETYAVFKNAIYYVYIILEEHTTFLRTRNLSRWQPLSSWPRRNIAKFSHILLIFIEQLSARSFDTYPCGFLISRIFLLFLCFCHFIRDTRKIYSFPTIRETISGSTSRSTVARIIYYSFIYARIIPRCLKAIDSLPTRLRNRRDNGSARSRMGRRFPRAKESIAARCNSGSFLHS